MTEYVLQIENGTQRLVKSYEVSEKTPIRSTESRIISEVGDLNRTQIVITDTARFNQIVEIYNEHKEKVKFTADDVENTITWVIEK